MICLSCTDKYIFLHGSHYNIIKVDSFNGFYKQNGYLIKREEYTREY